MDRRDFLRAGVAGMALSTVGNYIAESASQKRRRVGLIGCGWYGKSAMFRLLQIEPVEIVSLCDVDSKMLGEAAGMVAERQTSKKTPHTYGDYREMLKREKLDIVNIGAGLDRGDHGQRVPMVGSGDVYDIE
ncbi:MAG: gfo/Idh/MocA family oxidoreductase, partial [Planctomycetota bacterium]|nr:gfo/Idh/MocA family oxidoreductase [Planctomycetota bacterium]